MASASNPIPGAESVEELLASLSGIISAHVVTDATGALVEIHILSDADSHPKQVVRNVESALSAGLGLAVDRRIVSVAQVQSDLEGNGHRTVSPLRAVSSEEPHSDADAGVEARPRLEFVRYESHRDAERCTCTVVLRSGSEQVQGSGTGPDTLDGRAEAAARAVFDGMGLARPEVDVQLEGVVISSSRGRKFVIVGAQTVLHRTPVRLAGAAVMTRSPEEAAIMAALQASNRWSA